jgi:hypothetical protein
MGKCSIIILLIGMLVWGCLAWGKADKPERERTNAPGDPVTCAHCHGNLNTGPGRVTVYAPQQYMPGDTIDLFIEVAHPGQSRWGFEMTVLDDNLDFAGKFINVDPERVDIGNIDVTSQRYYARQRASGTDPGTFDVSPGWAVKWISPTDPAMNINFYCVGNATNNDNTQNGDYIYTTQIRYEPPPPTGARPASWSRLKSRLIK